MVRWIELVKNINLYVNEHIQIVCFDIGTGLMILAYFNIIKVLCTNFKNIRPIPFIITLIVYLSIGYVIIIHYIRDIDLIKHLLIVIMIIISSGVIMQSLKNRKKKKINFELPNE